MSVWSLRFDPTNHIDAPHRERSWRLNGFSFMFQQTRDLIGNFFILLSSASNTGNSKLGGGTRLWCSMGLSMLNLHIWFMIDFSKKINVMIICKHLEMTILFRFFVLPFSKKIEIVGIKTTFLLTMEIHKAKNPYTSSLSSRAGRKDFWKETNNKHKQWPNCGKPFLVSQN